MNKSCENELVTVEQIPDTAKKGWWMARDLMGRPLCFRSTKEAALQRGIEMAKNTRMKVCGWIG